MNANLARIADVQLIHDGERQSLLIEFNDGKVRSFSPKELYEATGYLGEAPPMDNMTGGKRRAAEILSSRRSRG